MHEWRPTDAAKTYVITAREKYGVSYRKDWVLGDRAPPGLEQRFKNPQQLPRKIFSSSFSLIPRSISLRGMFRALG